MLIKYKYHIMQQNEFWKFIYARTCENCALSLFQLHQNHIRQILRGSFITFAIIPK